RPRACASPESGAFGGAVLDDAGHEDAALVDVHALPQVVVEALAVDPEPAAALLNQGHARSAGQSHEEQGSADAGETDCRLVHGQPPSVLAFRRALEFESKTPPEAS